MSRSGSFYPPARCPFLVMAGLDPAIHVFARRRVGLAERDARIESGHDECWRGSVGETVHRPDRMRMNFRNTTLAGDPREAGAPRKRSGIIGDRVGFRGIPKDRRRPSPLAGGPRKAGGPWRKKRDNAGQSGIPWDSEGQPANGPNSCADAGTRQGGPSPSAGIRDCARRGPLALASMARGWRARRAPCTAPWSRVVDYRAIFTRPASGSGYWASSIFISP